MSDPLLHTGINPERHRRHAEALGLEMMSELTNQAREILQLADRAETDETFRSTANYRHFREKIGEFESFCHVIETQLKRIAPARRAELEDLFFKRRAAILRPAVRALSAFFGRIAADGALPLGILDALDGELQSIESMRAEFSEPAFAAIADRGILDEIAQLEALVMSLRANATQFEAFSEEV